MSFQQLECSVTSLLPTRQSTPLRLKFHPHHIQNEPLPLFMNLASVARRGKYFPPFWTSYLRFLLNLATAVRILGGFASSYEANYASTSETPSPSHSERTASAFYYYSNAAAPPTISVISCVIAA